MRSSSDIEFGPVSWTDNGVVFQGPLTQRSTVVSTNIFQAVECTVDVKQHDEPVFHLEVLSPRIGNMFAIR